MSLVCKCSIGFIVLTFILTVSWSWGKNVLNEYDWVNLISNLFGSKFIHRSTQPKLLTNTVCPCFSGGMNLCSCKNEWDYRQNIKKKDTTLYTLLNGIYNNNREYLEGRLHLCDWWYDDVNSVWRHRQQDNEEIFWYILICDSIILIISTDKIWDPRPDN